MCFGLTQHVLTNYKHSMFLGQPRYAYDCSNLRLILCLNYVKNSRTSCHSCDLNTTSEGPTRIYKFRNSHSWVLLKIESYFKIVPQCKGTFKPLTIIWLANWDFLVSLDLTLDC